MAAAGPYPGSHSNGTASEGSSRPRSAFLGVDALRAKAREEVTLSRWSSLDSLVDEASKSNIHVNTGMGFGRPDQAYVEWLKCEEYLRMLVDGSRFNNLSEEKRRKVMAVQKDHDAQRKKVRDIEVTLKASSPQFSGVNNPFTSIRPDSRQSTYDGVLPERSNRYTLNGEAVQRDGGPDPSYAHRRQGSMHSQGSVGSTNGVPVRASTWAQEDPLMDRFSQLRNSTPKDQLNGARQSGIPDSLRPARPSTPNGVNGTNGGPKPAGPRAMPVNKELPATPPSLSVGALLDSLPRAPSPIYTPAMPTQNPNATPPRTSSMAYSGGPSRPSKEKAPFPELSDPTSIDPEGLFDRMKSFKLLLLDVRPRAHFDEGHIHAKNIVCIEPIMLTMFQPLGQLEEKMLYAPEDEVNYFKRLESYDLVVFYDQKTSSGRFLDGPPSIDRSPHMRFLFDSLTEFNYDLKLQRKPAFLVGGLDSWIDLVSANALQSSNTFSKTVGPQPQRRRTTRASIVGANSSREIRAHRLAAYNPLDADEQRKWLETARNEEQAPTDIRQFQQHTEGESVSSQTEDELFLPYRDVNDFFRRTNDASQARQSMTSPASSDTSLARHPAYAAAPHPPRSQPPPPQYVPPAAPPPPIPPIPSRPPPTASRPSYSGVSDRRAVPNTDQQARASKPRPPIYQSRSLAHTLKLPRTGLKNFGVTCYMNSTIQCLNATIPLSRFFLDETWRQFVRKNWRGSNGIMPEIFANLIRGIWRNETAAVRPTSFMTFCQRMNPDWGNSRQQDAKEFLEFLIDTLHEDFNDNFNRTVLDALTPKEEAYREEMGKKAMNRVSRKEWERYTHREYSYVSSLFAGQHASRLRCTTCNKTSTTYEAFYSISVEIPREGVGDVRACLQSYCKEERLSGDELWQCPHCNAPRAATKQIIITRLPTVLVIHFKRFSASRSESARKVHTPIEFPLYGLDMQPYMANTYLEPARDETPDLAITPPFRYDCYAVMRHIGQSGGSGHYVALCRDAARACWRRYDDDSVSDFDPNKLRHQDRLQNQQAYIVFYERANPR